VSNHYQVFGFILLYQSIIQKVFAIARVSSHNSNSASTFSRSNRSREYTGNPDSHNIHFHPILLRCSTMNSRLPSLLLHLLPILRDRDDDDCDDALPILHGHGHGKRRTNPILRGRVHHGHVHRGHVLLESHLHDLHAPSLQLQKYRRIRVQKD
ncbi:hypothetical protein PENTCL1PPCAC_17049, partial [Pristionchus entomophagus]